MYDIYSSDHGDQWRYTLGKSGRRPLLTIGLNPSTATAERLDPTVTRVEKVAKLAGFDGFVMLNLYPVRATDYREAMRALLIEVVCGRHRPDIYDNRISGVGWKQAPADAENPRFISPNLLTLTVAKLGLSRINSPEEVTVDEHGRKIKRQKGKKATGVSLTMVRNEVLAERNEEDHAAGRPWLTSIVCAPGDTPMLSYFRDLERLRGVALRSKDERAAYHHEELLRVFAYSWDAPD